MGRDESGTLAALKTLRREVVDPPVAAHGGRIVKSAGDGLLLEFPSVVDAVRCVVEVQTAMAERGAALPEDERIALRIGVNLGDVIIEGDDIFGDGVNIAARLEGIAEPGSICVSDDAWRQVRGKLDLVFEDAGLQTLKNIAQPVQVWRWAANGAAAAPSVPLTLPDKPSIAVLPFQNLSGDPEQEYFADGMVEDIITALSRFKSLFVIARNSSFTYKGKAVDVKRIGRELGVRYVLEGSVRKAAGRVRITGQLIDSETGTHLWADRFDGALQDIFELQDRITASVVGAVAPRLDQAEMERARRKQVGNLDAYDCFLRGMASFYDRTVEARQAALRLFYRAIELDPNFATPYAMAARCYVARKQENQVVDSDREAGETRRLAMRAQDVGRDDALALCWAGHAIVFVCHEYETGTAMIDRALLINPNLAAAWQTRGIVSIYLGDYAAGIERLTHVLRLNPLDPQSGRSETFLGWACLLQGKYDEAQKWANGALSRQPNATAAMRVSAAANALAGRIPEARRVATAMLQLNPTMSISYLSSNSPFRRSQDLEKVLEGWRLAGIPE